MQKITRNTFKLAVVLVVLLAMFGAGFNSSVAYAASCSPTVSLDLYAKTGTATLYGTTTTPIWGYAANSGDLASLPGPVLDVNEGECVQVTLHNVDIPEATSLLFQGQDMIPDITGVTAGGSTSYIFSASAGTFLYEAGLIPNAQHQVAMGMYGAMIVRPLTAGQAYADSSTAFDSESVMVLSELDLALNNSGTPETFDMRDYLPQYFLINGKAYPDTNPFAVDPGPGSKVLVRYVNAGMQAHAMSTLGLSQTIIAQDGQLYAYSHNVVAETIATGQTLDTIITIPSSSIVGDQFVLYDANMLLHNTTEAGFGGMMATLTVGNGTPPEVDNGPTVSGLSLSPNPTDGSVDVIVSATITDGGTNASNIATAEFYIDGTANAANAMTAVDLAFDSTSEAVEGTIPVTTLAGLTSGDHTIFVRGQDANGNWGPFLSMVLNLDKAGPATTGLSLNPNPSDGFVPVDLTATGDDTATGGSNVTAAEYWVDGTDPGAGNGTAMIIVAGADAPIRDFTATIPAGFGIGAHTVSVRSQDSFGNWGAVATINLQVADPEVPTTSNVIADPNPTNGLVGFNTSVLAVRITADFSDVVTGGSNIVAAEGFIDSVGSIGSGFVFIANDGSFDSPSESGTADIPLASVRALSDGDHTIYVRAKDSSGNWGDPMAVGASTTLTVDKTGPTFSPITVSPPFADRAGGNNFVTVTLSGDITDSITGVDTNSGGTFTITDSKSNNVVTGFFTIDGSGHFSFTTDISQSNNGNRNNPANRRYYTFTLHAADNLGNIGTGVAQFYIQ
jgi:FtsP/CotA-like multicopper oxidase with cupredoxin domain